MKALLCSLAVAVAITLAFVACERVVVLVPAPGDAGVGPIGPDAAFTVDSGTFPDAVVGRD